MHPNVCLIELLELANSLHSETNSYAGSCINMQDKDAKTESCKPDKCNNFTRHSGAGYMCIKNFNSSTGLVTLNYFMTNQFWLYLSSGVPPACVPCIAPGISNFHYKTTQISLSSRKWLVVCQHGSHLLLIEINQKCAWRGMKPCSEGKLEHQINYQNHS